MGKRATGVSNKLHAQVLCFGVTGSLWAAGLWELLPAPAGYWAFAAGALIAIVVLKVGPRPKRKPKIVTAPAPAPSPQALPRRSDFWKGTNRDFWKGTNRDFWRRGAIGGCQPPVGHGPKPQAMPAGYGDPDEYVVIHHPDSAPDEWAALKDTSGSSINLIES